jgi:hypothetical protein
MATEPSVKAAAAAEISNVRLVPDLPVIFADGVTSQSYGPGISKFFFHRWDPHPQASEPVKTVPILQMVMPTDGFLGMCMFFEERLRVMVEQGFLTQADIDKKRDFYKQTRDSPSA